VRDVDARRSGLVRGLGWLLFQSRGLQVGFVLGVWEDWPSQRGASFRGRWNSVKLSLYRSEQGLASILYLRASMGLTRAASLSPKASSAPCGARSGVISTSDGLCLRSARSGVRIAAGASDAAVCWKLHTFYDTARVNGSW